MRIPMTSILTAAIVGLFSAAHAAEFNLDIEAIEAAAGAKGTLNKDEGVFKVTYPRNDIRVSVDGTVLPPFMGLTSWASFMPGKAAGAMIMGDMVLMQDEVNPAMSTALENGLEVTALHNHFFYDDPKVYFMHIGGEGDAVAMAAAVKKIQATIAEIRAVSPEPAEGFGGKPLPESSSISPVPIEELLGKGQAKDGMFKVVIGRTVKMPCGCEAGKEMGVNTWAAFYGTDNDAFADGDFAVLAGELQAVLKSLRSSGINVVAIHNHMTEEEPRVIFLHYWGRGPAAELARSLKAALEKTSTLAKP